MVEPQQATYPLATLDRSRPSFAPREFDQLTTQALMIPFPMAVNDELSDGRPQMTLAEQHELVEAPINLTGDYSPFDTAARD